MWVRVGAAIEPTLDVGFLVYSNVLYGRLGNCVFCTMQANKKKAKNGKGRKGGRCLVIDVRIVVAAAAK